MKSLPLRLSAFGCIEREKRNEKYVRNKCGRDFFYYAFHYFYPKKINSQKTPLLSLEKELGIPVHSSLAWTQLQFIHTPQFLAAYDLTLSINNRTIDTFLDFVRAILTPNRTDVKAALHSIEQAINKKLAVGVDISLGYAGLLDHVMFVYGYDKKYLYVIDSHQVPGLEYEKITQDNRFLMKLPKSVVKKRWSYFSRIWIIQKKH